MPGSRSLPPGCKKWLPRLAGLLVATALGQPCLEAQSQTLPPGFRDTVAFSGLIQPVAVRFARDGRIFVAEKRGLVRAFSNLGDTSADIVADLRTNVMDYWDRGMLGLALDPDFPIRPYIYVLYTYDAPIGGTAPTWNDRCPTPPGPTDDGCVVSGRLSRLEVGPDNKLVGSEQVLIQDNWCQQYPSHSIGALTFGPEGALYVSAGDGASFTFIDYGQGGGSPGSPTPSNPCGDPPSGVGGIQIPPTAEGGALRTQDLRTPGDPVAYNGSILRVNPDTGEAWPTNPLIGGDPGDDRVIAYGLRNPYRVTIRPGTHELWIGDVGMATYDEIDRIPDPSGAPGALNFGWPCYEGPQRQAGYDSANLDICERLYAEGPGAVVPPYFTYLESGHVVPGGDACPAGNSSIAGLAFYSEGSYPEAYRGALFFVDFSRDCMFVLRQGGNGDPDPKTPTAFEVAASNPVDLQIGPGGDLFYVDIDNGQIHRLEYSTSNQPPAAVIRAAPTSGQAPLTVQFDGSSSSDPDPGTTLFYRWDLDGDGQFDDAALPTATFTYTEPRDYMVGLQVTDDDGATNVAQLKISAGNTAPTASITAPAASYHWRVGDVISFAGQGSDPEDGRVPASSMRWDIIMHHCPGGELCHPHFIESYLGVDNEALTAPDHEWYSYLEFKLTVTDAGGLTDVASLALDPLAVMIRFATSPPGLSLSVGSSSAATPFDLTFIDGSLNTISAPSPQLLGDQRYKFVSWSDGGAQSHEVVADDLHLSYSAAFTACALTETCDGFDNDCDGSIDEDFTDLGAVCIAGVGQCLRTGAKVCSADGSGTLCSATPGAPTVEICDGLDNDCNGAVDDVPVPAGSPLLSVEDPMLAWTPLVDASAYDVVYGDAALLNSTGGDFTQAMLGCVINDTGQTTADVSRTPEPGQVFWFLVRGVSCSGSGTFDAIDPAQVTSRDAGINASPHSCPGAASGLLLRSASTAGAN